MDPTGEASNPWQLFMDALWQLYDAGYTNVMNDIQSEAKTYQQVATQGATIIAQNAPWTWDVWDAYALATGKDLYTGEKVDWWGRVITWAALFIPGVSGSEVRAGKNAWTQVISKSFDLKSIKWWRIDVENPWNRVWQIHFQVSWDKNKYMLNLTTNQFHIKTSDWQLAWKAIQNILKNTEVQKAISKAKNILWIKK